jgi:hypothetical protein
MMMTSLGVLSLLTSAVGATNRPINDSGMETHKGKHYVVLHRVGRLSRLQGPQQRQSQALKRYPKALE